MDKQNLFTLDVNNNILRFLFALIIALPISVVPLLLNSPEDMIFTSLPFYITIVILFFSIMYFRYWSLIIGFITFLICCFITGLGLKESIINISINIVQLLLLLLGYDFVKRIKFKSPNRYATGGFELSIFNFMLLVIVIFYFTSYNLIDISKDCAAIICSALIFIITVAKAILNRDIHLIAFTIFVALIPSVLCSVASAYLFQVPSDVVGEYLLQWCGSNYILLQSLGYIAYQKMYKATLFSNLKLKEPLITIKVGTIIYYIAVLMWNVIIILLYSNNLFLGSSYMFFLPWLLGNVILGVNMIFSYKNYTDQTIEDKFAWYEERVSVVERNTSAVVRIIAFLLPLSISLIQSIPIGLKTIFISNIFFACMSLGLVWVPSNNVKLIALLKDLKTILYSYTIAFLLLSSMLIIHG